MQMRTAFLDVVAMLSVTLPQATPARVMRALRWIVSVVLSAGLASGCASLGNALGRIGPERSVLHAPSVFDCDARAENADVFGLQCKSNSSEMG